MAERVGPNNIGQSKVSWVISPAGKLGQATRPEKTDGSARSSWGLESRKRWSHQGLRWCTHPRRRLPRRSGWLERNQNRSPL